MASACSKSGSRNGGISSRVGQNVNPPTERGKSRKNEAPAGSPLLAQEKAAGVSRDEEAMTSFQAVNASIDTILQEYQQLTGNALIKDSSLAANALPISISVPRPGPRSELVRIIQSILLRDFVF
jgi:hypothetical protein